MERCAVAAQPPQQIMQGFTSHKRSSQLPPVWYNARLNAHPPPTVQPTEASCITFCLQVCKQADGYQPHLVSSERGLRLLASEALGMVEKPVKTCLLEVYSQLVAAAKCVAELFV